MTEHLLQGRDIPALFHPAAILVVTLSLMLGLQAASPWLLLLFCGLTLSYAPVRATWTTLIRRNRWLLLSLLLILAYGLPGEGVGGMDWLPSKNGLLDALLHALRLLALLSILAWMLTSCPEQRLLLGLWSLLKPFGHLGVPVATTMTRLALVLERLHRPAPASSRNWLSELRQTLSTPLSASVSDTVQFTPMPWAGRDSLLLLAGALLTLFMLQTS